MATGATASGRDAEAKIFARVIASLNSAVPKFAKGDIKAMAEAIHLNDRLWLALSVDLLSEGNQLPNEIKSNLLNLSVYSQRIGRKVLLGEADPQELIDVNTSVMRGLRGKTGADKEEVAA